MNPQSQRQIIGYDPNTGRAIYGFDPNSGQPVFADPEPQGSSRQPIRVQMPDGKIAEFPGNLSQEQIANAVREQARSGLPKQAASPPDYAAIAKSFGGAPLTVVKSESLPSSGGSVQQAITAPSGRTYQWSKPTPPTAADWRALQDYDASLRIGARPGGQQTLAQMIRAKYPGAYDDLSDRDLEQAVKAKFPGVYDDIPLSAETQQGTPFNSARMNPMREDTPRFTADQVKTAATHLPMAGAILGTAMSGGAMAPAIAYAAGGAGVGQAVKDAQWQMPASQRVINAAKSAGGAAITQYGATKIPEVIGELGKAVYRGYLKPSLAGAEIAKAKEIVETALRENLPIADAGITKAKILVQRINKEVEQHLKNARFGKPIDLTKIADRVRSFANGMYNRPGAPSEDLVSALKVADQIDQHASIGYAPAASGQIANPSAVTPLQANEAKQALDKAVGDTGFGVERNAATEARKVGRHAARMAVEDVVPAVAPLNKRESQIIDTIDALTKAVGRESNKNPFTGTSSLMSMVAGAGAGAASDSAAAGLVATVAARLMLSPGVASRGAILAGRFARVPGTSVAQAVRMGLLIAQRESGQRE